MAESVLNRIDKQFFNAPKEIKYLILGDSRASFGINPLYLSESFNFASPGENYMQTYYKFKYVISKRIKRIENVIISYDLHAIYSSLDVEVMDDSFWKKYLNFFEISEEINNKNFVNLWLKANFFAYAGNISSIFDYILKKNILKQDIQNGQVVKTTSLSSWIDKISPAKNRVAWQFEDHTFSDTLILYFNKLLSLCKNNNIRVILIKFPVSQEYFTEVKKIIPVQQFDRMIDSLLLNYSDIELMDYRQLYANRSEYFFDVDHLNAKGSIEFSKFLSKKFKEKKLY